MVDENNEEVEPLITPDAGDVLSQPLQLEKKKQRKKSLFSKLSENRLRIMQQKYCNKKPTEESDVIENQSSKFINPLKKFGGCDHYPIHCAANSGLADNLEVLLKKNSSIVKQLDSNKRTALLIVIQSITKENYKTSFKAIETLINYNADINFNNSSGVDSPLNLIIRLHSEIGDVIKEEWQAMLEFIDEKVDFIDLNLLKNDVQEILKLCLPALWKNCNDYKFPYKLDIKANSKDFWNDKKKFLRTLYSLSKDPKLEKYFQNMIKDRHLLSSVFRNTEFTDMDVQKTLAIGKIFFTKETFCKIFMDGSMNHKSKLKKLLDIWKERGYGTFKEPILHKKNWSSSEYEMLLNHPDIDLNMLDENGDSALCYHIGQGDQSKIRALMKKDVFIGSLKANEKITAMDIIDSEMLEEHLDSRIGKKMEKGTTRKKSVNYMYQCFKPPLEYRRTVNELTAINCIASNKKLQHLIQHPLITSFLLLKWNLICPIFYLNLIFYFINFIMLMYYMAFSYGQKDTSNWYACMPFIFASTMLIREVLQRTFLSFKRYFFSLSNCMEWVLIVLTFYISLHRFELDENRRGVGALVILLAAMELMILFATIQILSLSLYMRMLKKVTASFIHAFFLYSVILMAFAFSFYTLFGFYGEQEQVNSTDSSSSLKITNPAFAALKTFVMFAGEFEANDLNFEFSNWIGYFIFVMFVFFIAIIMMNLLSGLAVSDTQQIISDARLDDWIERAKLLESFEKILITSKKLDDLIPIELKNNMVKIEIHDSAKLIAKEKHKRNCLKWFADHLKCFGSRPAENTTSIDTPASVVAESEGCLKWIVDRLNCFGSRTAENTTSIDTPASVVAESEGCSKWIVDRLNCFGSRTAENTTSIDTPASVVAESESCSERIFDHPNSFDSRTAENTSTIEVLARNEVCSKWIADNYNCFDSRTAESSTTISRQAVAERDGAETIADNPNGFESRIAEDTTRIDMPIGAETNNQLTLTVRLKRYLEQRTKKFLINFSIDELDIVKNSLQILNKCEEEIKKKDNSRAYEEQFKNVFLRQSTIEETLKKRLDLLESIAGHSSQMKK